MRLSRYWYQSRSSQDTIMFVCSLSVRLLYYSSRLVWSQHFPLLSSQVLWVGWIRVTSRKITKSFSGLILFNLYSSSFQRMWYASKMKMLIFTANVSCDHSFIICVETLPPCVTLVTRDTAFVMSELDNMTTIHHHTRIFNCCHGQSSKHSKQTF